ncbi:MAG TPA: isoleucine--tRNA ligase [bacterium]|nr:isoleucine--tRNA ligase [bacterium]
MEDFSKTVLLPKTSFPMKGNLNQKEPEFLRLWDSQNIYGKVIDKNKGGECYLLHDGPPYANGHIHLGTALNKILKDVVVKYKSLRGMYSPYKPGWDCHGMPIEHQIFRDMKAEKGDVDVVKFRKKAADYARKFMSVQREEFKRLGVLGEWENPYLTLNHEYEATIINAFGKLYMEGYIHQAYKPIYWCISCETALAEAEIEYENSIAPSIYIKFPVTACNEKIDKKNLSFLVWTTTPWTLPGNTAIAVNPDIEYAVAETPEGRFILAKSLVETVFEKKGLKAEIIKTFKGTELEGWKYSHPLLNRESRIILADYVSAEDGTGCVHTAPGHGEEDYYAGIKNNLDILSPVDEKGRFTGDVKDFEGIRVFDANPLIIEALDKNGSLFCREDIEHSYPHCWRCKKPVIFRSTKQWFLKIDHNGLRKGLKNEIEKTEWVPCEGKNRIGAMVEMRPDWCLSRQRLWGVHIPAFYCKNCGNAVITQETLENAERLIREHGSDIWIEKSEKELLPEGFRCPHCKGDGFTKEKDILDVWFDSGVSHLAVLKKSPDMKWPADLYLEGSDQHRGWFQTSLITSCGIEKRAPYKTVLTHGFVVDAEGKKMSKSLGNVITPEELIKKYGAEIVRIWSISENYQQDVRISDNIIANVVMTYKRIRNTIRFLLGNLDGFSPAKALEDEQLKEVDRWALEKLRHTVNTVTGYYDSYALNKVYEELHNYCNLYLSSFYLDQLKDRLYTHGRNSLERKSGQTVLYRILMSLLKISAPILSFTSEEAYQAIPWKDKKESVFLEDWPEIKKPDGKLLEKWERFFEFRKKVLKKIEEKREAKIVHGSLEAKITISAPEDMYEFLQTFENLEGLFIVSEVILEKGTEEITVENTSFNKCSRCWVHFPEVGKNERFPLLCGKCVRAIEENSLE